MLDKRTAKEKNSASQNDDGCADVLASAGRAKRADAKSSNMACGLCPGLFVFDVFHKRVMSPNIDYPTAG